MKTLVATLFLTFGAFAQTPTPAPVITDINAAAVYPGDSMRFCAKEFSTGEVMCKDVPPTFVTVLRNMVAQSKNPQSRARFNPGGNLNYTSAGDVVFRDVIAFDLPRWVNVYKQTATKAQSDALAAASAAVDAAAAAALQQVSTQ